MKNLIIVLSVIAVFLAFNLENASNDIPESFTSGKWHIVNYLKNAKEKQDLYAAFDFTFSKANHITVKENNHSYTGDWAITKGDITDDDPSRGVDLNILFKDKNGLSELNGEWKIEKRTSNYLSLIQINNDGEDHLIFERKHS